MATPHERLSKLEIDEDVRRDALNVLTSISNYGGRIYSWILREDLRQRGAGMSRNIHFDLTMENALYVLINAGIIGRDGSGAYFIKQS